MGKAKAETGAAEIKQPLTAEDLDQIVGGTLGKDATAGSGLVQEQEQKRSVSPPQEEVKKRSSG